MASEIETAIGTAATEPAAATVDGVTMTARSIDEMIKADRYLRAKEAAATTGKTRLKFAKFVPPGTINSNTSG
jgi:hypothetical protein